MKTFKIGTMLKLGVPYLIFFFTPIVPLVLAVGVLSLTDTITGIAKAKKIGERIHSSKMTRTITKMVFYAIAIILGRLMEVHFIPWMPIAQITAGYIALVEFKSNMENIGLLTGTDLWKGLKERFEGAVKGKRE
jgi:phage-related holin